MGLPYVHKHIKFLTDPVAIQMELDGDGKTVVAIDRGDLIALDGGYPVAPEDFTWDTDEATTQAAFAAALQGVSEDRVRLGDPIDYTTDPDVTKPSILRDGTFLVYVEDGTYDIDDYIGPAQDGANNNLKNQCAVVASKSLATFIVEEPKTTTSADPFVVARLINTSVKR